MHPKVATMVAAIAQEGDVAAIPKEKYLAWQDELAQDKWRQQHRVYYDCLTVGLSLYKEGLLVAAWQFLILSALGIQSAEVLAKLRESGADEDLVRRFNEATKDTRSGAAPPKPKAPLGVGLRNKRR